MHNELTSSSQEISRVYKCLFLALISAIRIYISFFQLDHTFGLSTCMISLQGAKFDGVPLLRPLKLDDFTQAKTKVKSTPKLCYKASHGIMLLGLYLNERFSYLSRRQTCL